MNGAPNDSGDAHAVDAAPSGGEEPPMKLAVPTCFVLALLLVAPCAALIEFRPCDPWKECLRAEIVAEAVVLEREPFQEEVEPTAEEREALERAFEGVGVGRLVRDRAHLVLELDRSFKGPRRQRILATGDESWPIDETVPEEWVRLQVGSGIVAFLSRTDDGSWELLDWLSCPPKGRDRRRLRRLLREAVALQAQPDLGAAKEKDWRRRADKHPSIGPVVW